MMMMMTMIMSLGYNDDNDNCPPELSCQRACEAAPCGSALWPLCRAKTYIQQRNIAHQYQYQVHPSVQCDNSGDTVILKQPLLTHQSLLDKSGPRCFLPSRAGIRAILFYKYNQRENILLYQNAILGNPRKSLGASPGYKELPHNGFAPRVRIRLNLVIDILMN